MFPATTFGASSPASGSPDRCCGATGILSGGGRQVKNPSFNIPIFDLDEDEEDQRAGRRVARRARNRKHKNRIRRKR